MYTKTQWVDNTTPIDKDNLNKIEQGIYDNSLVVDAVTNTLNPTDTETYKTAELTEGQITDVIGVNDIVIKGQTLQDGEPTPSSPVDVNVVSGSNVVNTSNKNLLDISKLITQTQNGVTITKNKDMSITLNGTSTSAITIDVPIKEITLKENTTYVFSKNTNIAGASYALSLRESNTAYIDTTSLDGSAKSLNINLSTKKIAKYFRLYIVNGKTFTNHTFYPMLEQSSAPTTYEPHQGKELPLDLPVENLFNPTLNSQTLSSGTVITKNSDNSYTMSKGSSTADLIILGTINVKEGEIYYLSDQRVGGANNISLRRGGSVLVTTETNPIVKYTSTATETLNIYARYQSTSDLIYKPMISTKYSKTYVPYGTDPIELCKIGDYQDYFYKSGSKWYLHKEVGSFILNGNVSFQKHSSSNSYCTAISRFTNNVPVYPETNNIVAPIICTHFDATYINDIAFNSVQKIGFSFINSKEVWFGLPTSIATNVSEVQNWLNNQINNGNPIVVHHALATSTDTEITDTTLISQLEAIYNAPLYEQTNITQTNNDLPMVLDITACKDNINGIKAFIRK